MDFKKESHCSYCGSKFTEQVAWPRTCFICNMESYKNPVPVVVAMIRTFQRDSGAPSGWLIEQRGIEPKKYGWAFPSGYVEFGETWQQAMVRELQEEVGLTITSERLKLYEVVNSSEGNMLIFCTIPGGIYWDEVKFIPNKEVLDIRPSLLPEDQRLCFPSHNEMWSKYCNVRS
jgi:8-oxo-dGTP pyrophosphatase MutT (NUDIX family)